MKLWLALTSASVASLIFSTSVPAERVLDGLEGALDLVLLVALELLALLAQHLLGLVDERVGVVADLGLLAAALVVLGVRLGVAHHAVDLVLGQRRLAGDGHRLLLARGGVPSRHVHDAVGVDVEGDLDLRDAARRRGQVHELELAERLVVHGHLALALEHVDLHRRLVVLGRGEHLGALGGDGGVALDEPVHDAALGLDAERQRGDVEQQDVFDLALQHAGLDGGADGDDLVGVHALVGLLAGERPGRGPGWTGMRVEPPTSTTWSMSDLRQPGVGDGLLERALAGVDEVGGDLVELGPRELQVEVLGALGGGGDEGQVDLGLLDRRQLDLGLLAPLPSAAAGPSCRPTGPRPRCS